MTEENKWATCCRGRKCPEVLVKEDSVEIKDDHEGAVKLTFREFDLVVDVVKSMREHPESE
jgi:hypothetical protein